MTWKRNVLVVANVTATSPELVEALQTKAQEGACSFTIVVPATPVGGGREAAHKKLDESLATLQAAGLEVDGLVGSADPIVAVTDAWDPKRYDEILVSTLPLSSSKWLHAGLPERIAKLTGASVSHVVSRPEKPVAHASPAPPHLEHDPMLGALSVMGWGGHKEE